MSDRTAQARAEAVREAAQYIERLHPKGLTPKRAVIADLEIAADRMGRGIHANWREREADANPQPAAALRVDSSDMKMLGEALAVAENLISAEPQYRSLARHLGGLLRQVNHHRPTGTDGKHGDLHTATCGCDDG